MTDLFTDPKNLVKDLSTVIINAIWTYSPGRFKKNVFPEDKRYELVKNIALTSDTMIFDTVNNEELKKIRAKFDEHKFHGKLTPDEYTNVILNYLIVFIPKGNIYLGTRGFYEINKINVIRNVDGGYTIILNYKFYDKDKFDTYFSTLNTDIITLIIFQLFNQSHFYYNFTLAKRFLFIGIINPKEINWEYVMSLSYPKFYAYIKRVEGRSKDSLWWMDKFLDLINLVTGGLNPEKMVDNPTLLQRISYSYGTITEKLNMIAYLKDIGFKNLELYDSEAEFRAMSY